MVLSVYVESWFFFGMFLFCFPRDFDGMVRNVVVVLDTIYQSNLDNCWGAGAGGVPSPFVICPPPRCLT